MATRKQTEEGYRQVVKAIEKLNIALYSTRYITGNAENYKEESPYYSLWDLRQRVDKLFEKPIAKSVMNQIKYGNR